MNKQTKYIPSSFIAAFYPKRPVVEDKGVYDEFVDIAKSKPDISISTESFLIYISLSASTRVAVDQQNQTTLILHGEIYGSSKENQAQFLLERYIERGLSFTSEINGLFSILLVDKRDDTSALITDRVGSRKVFWREYKGNYWLSTSLHCYPSADLRADPIAIACALANGTVHNNRTLFDGIKSLERAGVHRFTHNGLNSTKYWSYEFTNSYAGVDEKKLRSELFELLVESVRVNLSDNPKVFVSLSAGYDASSILGILGSRLKFTGVDCISYSFGKVSPNSDAYVAGKMARLYGYNHRILESHHGKLLYTITRNAAMGQGISNFCDELDMWLALADEFSASMPSVLITGEGCYADAHGVRLDSYGDALRHIGITDFSELSWLRKFLAQDVYQALRDGLREDISQILARCPCLDDYHDVKDFLYLDQRLNNVVMPWRNYFAGQSITVRHPFLDNSLMDFMKALPGSLRIDKILYRNTLIEMLPDIFQIKRATVGHNVTHWRKEFIAEHDEFEDLVLSHKSKLDDIIPPEVICKLLKENRSWRHSKYAPRTLPARVSIVLFTGTRLGNMIMNRFPAVDLKNLLKRLLVIREFLSCN